MPKNVKLVVGETVLRGARGTQSSRQNLKNQQAKHWFPPMWGG